MTVDIIVLFACHFSFFTSKQHEYIQIIFWGRGRWIPVSLYFVIFLINMSYNFLFQESISKPYCFWNENNHHLIKNTPRIGVCGSRQISAEKSIQSIQHKWILFWKLLKMVEYEIFNDLKIQIWLSRKKIKFFQYSWQIGITHVGKFDLKHARYV